MDKIGKESTNVHFEAWLADDGIQISKIQEKPFQRRCKSRRRFGGRY